MNRWSSKIPVAIALLLIVFRAWNQDISIDEATTYRYFVAPLQMGYLEALRLTEGYWSGYSNNHLLSTLLISASTAAFGVSPFTLRLPALLAAALFCLFASAVAERLCGRSWRAMAVFVLLVFNPLVMDNLVAARGYALALACEMGMLLLMLRGLDAEDRPLQRRIAMSVLAGLAVAANYSFGFTIAALLAAELVGGMSREPFSLRGMARSAVALGAPAAAIVLLLCLDNLRTFQTVDMKGAWGVDSLTASFRSLAALSFSPANPLFVPPHLRGFFGALSQAAPWIALALGLAAIGWSAVGRLRRSPAVSHRFLLLMIGAFAVSVFLVCLPHWLIGMKLPYSRTGLQWMPLLTLLIAAPLYLTSLGPRLSAWAGRAGAGAIAVLYLVSLHTSYFMEWPWDADSCMATSEAMKLADQLGVKQIHAAWEMSSTTEFYAESFGYRPERVTPLMENDKKAFEGTDPKVFVLTPRMMRHIDTSGLKTALTLPLSGVIVAVRDAPVYSPPATTVRDRIEPRETSCRQHRWYKDPRLYPMTQCEAAIYCW